MVWSLISFQIPVSAIEILFVFCVLGFEKVGRRAGGQVSVIQTKVVGGIFCRFKMLLTTKNLATTRFDSTRKLSNYHLIFLWVECLEQHLPENSSVWLNLFFCVNH